MKEAQAAKAKTAARAQKKKAAETIVLPVEGKPPGCKASLTLAQIKELSRRASYIFSLKFLDVVSRAARSKLPTHLGHAKSMVRMYLSTLGICNSSGGAK